MRLQSIQVSCHLYGTYVVISYSAEDRLTAFTAGGRAAAADLGGLPRTLECALPVCFPAARTGCPGGPAVRFRLQRPVKKTDKH